MKLLQLFVLLPVCFFCATAAKATEWGRNASDLLRSAYSECTSRLSNATGVVEEGVPQASSVSSQAACAAGQNKVADAQQTKRFNHFYYQALACQLEGRMDQCWEYLNHCLVINPNSPDVLTSLGLYYSDKNQPEKALTYLRRARELNPTIPQLLDGMVALLLNKKPLPSEYYDVARQMMQMNPKDPSAYAPLLSAYQDEGKDAELLELLDTMDAKIGPSLINETLRFQTINKTQPEKAMKRLLKKVEEKPNDHSLQLFLASVYRDQNKQQKATDIYRKLLAEDSTDVNVRSAMLAQSMQINDSAGVHANLLPLLKLMDVDNENYMRLLSNYLKTYPQDIPMMMNYLLHKVNVTEQELELAAVAAEINKVPSDVKLDYYNQGLERFPDDAVFTRGVLLCLQDMGREDEMKARAQKMVDDSTSCVAPYYALFVESYKAGDREKAFNYLQAGVSQVSLEDNLNEALTSEVYSLYASMAWERGQRRKAIDALRTALTLEPENVAYKNDLAYFLSEEREDLDFAERISYEVVQQSPDDITYVDTYAWVLFVKGDYRGAATYLEGVLKDGVDTKDPDGKPVSAVVLEHMGDILIHCGDTNKAVQYWQKAYSLQPSALLKKKISQRRYFKK